MVVELARTECLVGFDKRFRVGVKTNKNMKMTLKKGDMIVRMTRITPLFPQAHPLKPKDMHPPIEQQSIDYLYRCDMAYGLYQSR